MNKFVKFTLNALSVIGIGIGAACTYESFRLLKAVDDISEQEAQEKARAKRAKEYIEIDPDDLDDLDL